MRLIINAFGKYPKSMFVGRETKNYCNNCFFIRTNVVVKRYLKKKIGLNYGYHSKLAFSTIDITKNTGERIGL